MGEWPVTNEEVAVAYIEAAALNVMRIDCGCDSPPECYRCLASNQLSKALQLLEDHQVAGRDPNS